MESPVFRVTKMAAQRRKHKDWNIAGLLFRYFTYEQCSSVHGALASHLIALQVSFGESDMLDKNLLRFILLVANSIFPYLGLIKAEFMGIAKNSCILILITPTSVNSVYCAQESTGRHG